jgi:maleate isomerase
VASRAELTPQTLTAMQSTIPVAADLLPKAPHYKVIGYGCTSGAMMIGADQVRRLITDTLPADHVTDPFTATLSALKTLKIQRLGLLTPYIESVARPLQHAFEGNGVAVPQTLSFGEEREARVARITAQSITQATRALAGNGQIDGVFLSCTNLQTLDVIPRLEDELGLPVLSSNQTFAWHIARLAGLCEGVQGIGRLWNARL